MRILLCGVAAVTLSGCSWLGYSTDGYSNGSAYQGAQTTHTDGGYYNPQVQTGQYTGGSYDSGSYDTGNYQYPIAKTYPIDFDPNGPLLGNTTYEAAPSVTTYHAPQNTAHHSGHTSSHYGARPENRWTVNGALGTEITTGGDIFNGTNAAGIFYNNVNMKDAYKPGLRAELGAARSLRGNRMVTGQLFYSKAEGERVNLRQAPTSTIQGTFSDHESYGAELGLRQYVSMSESAYKPYVEGRLGAAYVDDISLNNISPTGSATRGGNLDFIEGGWVPTGAALVGVERPLNDKVMLGLETGIRYSGGLDGEALPAASPLVGANDYQERWTVPVSLRGRYRF